MSWLLRLAGIVGIAYVAACIAVWVSDELAWARWLRQADGRREAEGEG